MSIKNYFLTESAKFSRWHALSIVLMGLFLLLPLNHIIIGLWNYTEKFIHDMGHAYFDLLAEDFSVTIWNDPPMAWVMKSEKFEEFIFIGLGGVIFTSIIYLSTILLVFLFFKYKNWPLRRSVNFGPDTIGFQLSMIVFTTFLLESINIIPMQFNGHTSDMAKLLGEYLGSPSLVLSETNQFLLLLCIMLFSFLIVLSMFSFYFILGSNCFYCITKRFKRNLNNNEKKEQRHEVNKKIQEFIQSETSEEDLLVFLKALPITMSGGEFFSSVGRLEDIMIKLVNTANMYPILNESFITIIEEKPDVHLDLGELSKDQLFELFRSFYLPKDYNVGRYVLSWLIMSLTSLVDRYFDDIIDEVGLSLKKGSKKNISEKKRIFLKEIGLWDEFLDEKAIYDQFETIFFQLVDKRNVVAHHSISINWAEELANRNLQGAINRGIKQQESLLKILNVNNGLEKNERRGMLKLIVLIKIFCYVFNIYIGLIDDFFTEALAETDPDIEKKMDTKYKFLVEYEKTIPDIE